MNMLQAMDKAKELLAGFSEPGKVESITLDELHDGYGLFVDFKDGSRKIYKYSEEQNAFVFEKDIEF